MVCSLQKSLLSPLWKLGLYRPISGHLGHLLMCPQLCTALDCKGLASCQLCFPGPLVLWLPIGFRQWGAVRGTWQVRRREKWLSSLLGCQFGMPSGSSYSSSVNSMGDGVGWWPQLWQWTCMAQQASSGISAPDARVTVALVQREIDFLWLLIFQ